MIIFDRIQRAIVRRNFRDDTIAWVSAMRDSGMTFAAIAKELDLPESSVRNIVKHIL